MCVWDSVNFSHKIQLGNGKHKEKEVGTRLEEVREGNSTASMRSSVRHQHNTYNHKHSVSTLHIAVFLSIYAELVCSVDLGVLPATLRQTESIEAKFYAELGSSYSDGWEAIKAKQSRSSFQVYGMTWLSFYSSSSSSPWLVFSSGLSEDAFN